MIRFPLDLRVDIMKAGLKLSQWQPAFFAKPKLGTDDPEILQYHFGEIHGILAWASDQVLTIVAIVNESPGNGDFPKCLDALESVAKERTCPVRVAAVWNRALLRHLVSKRGYRPDPKGQFSDAVIKRPQ